MSRIQARLEELGHTLPAAMEPPGNFQLVKVHAGIAYMPATRQSMGQRFSCKASSAGT